MKDKIKNPFFSILSESENETQNENGKVNTENKYRKYPNIPHAKSRPPARRAGLTDKLSDKILIPTQFTSRQSYFSLGF